MGTRRDRPIVHVVGARPNFMKAAPVIAALRDRGAPQRLVHTGQHYDASMSGVFLEELRLPEPDRNLEVGPGTHAAQTAAIMVAFERAIRDFDPSIVVVYGDVNSTIACALVAAKLTIPVAHVEAGLRSFDDSMPEEINRRLTDHLSSTLLVTAPEGLTNLAREGIGPKGVHFVGNPMIDTLLAFRGRLEAGRAARLGLPTPYAVVTVHRPSNVDDPVAAARIIRMLSGVTSVVPAVLPLHPRGRQALLDQGLGDLDGLTITDPLGYVEFMSLVAGAAMVITDSGGVQEETTVLGIPCLTIRKNTERPITITHGTNRLIEPEQVLQAAVEILSGSWAPPSERPDLWDGHAGARIADILVEDLARSSGDAR
jgi:UDP-N-acetylglucosamine 2-epimerase